MIPDNIKSKDLVGSRVRLIREITTGGGFVLPAGKICKVMKMGRGFTVKTDPCPCCGISVVIRGVTRNEVELAADMPDKAKQDSPSECQQTSFVKEGPKTPYL